jgi:ABC-type transport system involved in multi-copper enzyme maturation permease subunit
LLQCIIYVEKLNKITVVTVKEFKDIITDKIFLLSFILLFCSLGISMIEQGFTINEQIAPNLSGDLNPEIVFAQYTPLIFLTLEENLPFFGALVAICISYASIEQERKKGSLRLLLSYPIYRDQVILAKMLSRVLMLTLVSFASVSASFALVVMVTGFKITFATAIRILVIEAVTALYLSLFMGIGVYFSITSRDLELSAIKGMVIIFLFSSVWTHIVDIIMNVAAHFDPRYGINSPKLDMNMYRALLNIVDLVNPNRIFTKLVYEISQQYTSSISNGITVLIKVNLLKAVYSASQNLVVLMFYILMVYLLCYVSFRKMEVG